MTDSPCSPDKNPGVKNIHDRFARLGVITAILRSPEGRDRYNVGIRFDYASHHLRHLSAHRPLYAAPGTEYHLLDAQLYSRFPHPPHSVLTIVVRLTAQFFYKNGVPKWRGTGYYYSRYRPTLSHTLIFIAFLTSLAQRLVMQLNYNKDKRRVEYFERTARSLAGGGGMMKKVAEGEKVNVGGKRRKVRVPMIEGNEGAGTLELIVERENVYLVSLSCRF